MDLGFRNRVAEAVHRALGKITRSDGFSKCRQYLLAGVGLLSLLADRYCVPQAGPILTSEPSSDPWVGIDIGVGVFQAVTHAGLCGEVDHAMWLNL